MVIAFTISHLASRPSTHAAQPCPLVSRFSSGKGRKRGRESFRRQNVRNDSRPFSFLNPFLSFVLLEHPRLFVLFLLLDLREQLVDRFFELLVAHVDVTN